MNFRNMMFSAVAACTAVCTVSADEIPIKSGETVAFLGDSITELGTKNKIGYVNLVVDGLFRAGIDVKPVPAGISGNNSNHMLARVDRDVISKKPNWMFLSCGVNDAPNGLTGGDCNPGVPLETYSKNITAILDKCAEAGIQVIVLTATPVVEDPDHVANKNLVPYNEFLRKIATQKKLKLIDLNKVFNSYIATKKNKKALELTIDGTHMSPYGDIMMASAILNQLNLPEVIYRRCYEAWNNSIPAYTFKNMTIELTVAEMEKLDKIKTEDCSPEEFMKLIIHERLKENEAVKP